jgi:hypothetical protein
MISRPLVIIVRTEGPSVFQALSETKESISKFLKDDFDTKSSVCALIDLMTLANSMLNAEKKYYAYRRDYLFVCVRVSLRMKKMAQLT